MTEYFPTLMAIIFYLVLAVSIAPMIYRIVRGPHILDRVMAVDAVVLITICIIAVWKLQVDTTHFFDAVLVLAIVGFISSVALAKYLENGDLID